MGLCYYNKVMGVNVSLCGKGITTYSVISQFDVRKYMNNRRKRPCVGLCHLNRVAKAKVAIKYFFLSYFKLEIMMCILQKKNNILLKVRFVVVAIWQSEQVE